MTIETVSDAGTPAELQEEKSAARAEGAVATAQGGAHGGSRLPRLAYSVSEAAEMLGVSTKTIRRLIARGLKIGRASCRERV